MAGEMDQKTGDEPGESSVKSGESFNRSDSTELALLAKKLVRTGIHNLFWMLGFHRRGPHPESYVPSGRIETRTCEAFFLILRPFTKVDGRQIMQPFTVKCVLALGHTSICISAEGHRKDDFPALNGLSILKDEDN